MKQIQTNQYIELQTLTPELGIFLVTGAAQDVIEASRSFSKCQSVSQSTFARVVSGKPVLKLVPWFL